MKKQLIILGLASLFITNLYAKEAPASKKSLALEVGMAEMKPKSHLEDVSLSVGLNFKMEERVENSKFYVGFGSDFNHMKYKTKMSNIDFMNISVYPTISYNAYEDIFVNGFVGINYMFGNNDRSNEEHDFGYVVGIGAETSLNDKFNHGVTYRRYLSHEIDNVDVNQHSFMYKVGYKF